MSVPLSRARLLALRLSLRLLDGLALGLGLQLPVGPPLEQLEQREFLLKLVDGTTDGLSALKEREPQAVLTQFFSTSSSLAAFIRG
jgi:hypothetical protein